MLGSNRPDKGFISLQNLLFIRWPSIALREIEGFVAKGKLPVHLSCGERIQPGGKLTAEYIYDKREQHLQPRPGLNDFMEHLFFALEDVERLEARHEYLAQVTKEEEAPKKAFPTDIALRVLLGNPAPAEDIAHLREEVAALRSEFHGQGGQGALSLGGGTQEGIGREELLSRAKRLLNTLDPKSQKHVGAWIHRQETGCTVQELADYLHMSKRTAEHYLTKAKLLIPDRP